MLQISIIDVGETAPSFAGSDDYEFYINENIDGSSFTPGEDELIQRVFAVDLDTGSNIEQTFKFSVM